MKDMKRRDFLKTLGAGLAALALPKGAGKDAPQTEAVPATTELADELVEHYSEPAWVFTPDTGRASATMTAGAFTQSGDLVAIAHLDGETVELRKGSGRWNFTANRDVIPFGDGYNRIYQAGLSSYTLTLTTEHSEIERSYAKMEIAVDEDGIDHWYLEHKIDQRESRFT